MLFIRCVATGRRDAMVHMPWAYLKASRFSTQYQLPSKMRASFGQNCWCCITRSGGNIQAVFSLHFSKHIPSKACTSLHTITLLISSFDSLRISFAQTKYEVRTLSASKTGCASSPPIRGHTSDSYNVAFRSISSRYSFQPSFFSSPTIPSGQFLLSWSIT